MSASVGESCTLGSSSKEGTLERDLPKFAEELRLVIVGGWRRQPLVVGYTKKSIVFVFEMMICFAPTRVKQKKIHTTEQERL